MNAPASQQDFASATQGALTRFSGERYIARKKIFAFLGQQFHIYDPDMNLCCYVKQKAFKLKEAITVFTDESMATPVLMINARKVMDFSATYDVTTPEGARVGALKREGMKSIFRDKWLILDTNDQPVGHIEEDSMGLALLRRFLVNLIPQTYVATMNGQLVARFSQRFNPFVFKMDVDFSLDGQNTLDRRLGIAAVVLLLAIEGRQN